jgi:uncharacterized protein (UPF0548 family)
MFCLSRPSRQSIIEFISAQSNQTFSYAEVGFSRQQAPRGYIIDHNRINLGHGPDTFQKAKVAIRQWKMFDMSWVSLCWPETPIESGATVAVLISHLGFWSLNASRIVYVIQEQGRIEKYGFAYGTLAGHAEIGEERFTVEFNQDDQTVWFDLYAFSRPHLAARFAYPFSRMLQKRFARHSKAAMYGTVSGLR